VRTWSRETESRREGWQYIRELESRTRWEQWICACEAGGDDGEFITVTFSHKLKGRGILSESENYSLGKAMSPARANKPISAFPMVFSKGRPLRRTGEAGWGSHLIMP
jgi:hypothetical protein